MARRRERFDEVMIVNPSEPGLRAGEGVRLMNFYGGYPGLGYYGEPYPYGGIGEEYLAEEPVLAESDLYGYYAEPDMGFYAEPDVYGELDPLGYGAAGYGAYAEDPYGALAADPYGAYAEDPYGAYAQDPYGAQGEDPYGYAEPEVGYFAEEPYGYGWYGGMPEMVGYGGYAQDPSLAGYAYPGYGWANPELANYGYAGYTTAQPPAFNAGCTIPTNVSGYDEGDYGEAADYAEYDEADLAAYNRPAEVNPTVERFTPPPSTASALPETLTPLW
ncbi:MAG: hypothetical protein ACREMA_00890 [Longimicrobiales bacterium]